MSKLENKQNSRFAKIDIDRYEPSINPEELPSPVRQIPTVKDPIGEISRLERKWISGDTDLNKLKYKPFMSKGEVPLVTKRVPTGQNQTPVETNERTTRVDDLTRIAKLIPRKEGVKFATNNTQLNTAVDLSYTVQGTIKDKLSALGDVNRGKALLDTLGTIGTTLAQVPVAGTGIHFVKGVLFGSKRAPFNKPSKTTQLIGDPGSVVIKYGRDPYYEVPSNNNGQDIINVTSPYTGETVRGNMDDYIKFYFEVLRPGEQQNVFLHFRAFLDNFADNYLGNWGAINYVGRGETFYTYQSFNRSVNITFKSAVATKQELAPVYQKLTYLASTTAPSYSTESDKSANQTGGIMRGTIVRLTLGDYLYDTPGILNNVSFNWESNFPFEIKLGTKDSRLNEYGQPVPDDNSDYAVQELPHVLTCNLTFTPIHTFTPQVGLYPYITNTSEQSSKFFDTPDQGYDGGVSTIPEGKKRDFYRR